MMLFTSIRRRMLLAALMPVVLVIVVLSSVFWMNRMNDLDATFLQHARLIARQAAASGVYGVFAGNVAVLGDIAAGAAKEPDVRSVAIFDINGKKLVSVGPLTYLDLDQARSDVQAHLVHQRNLELLVEPISSGAALQDDMYSTMTLSDGSVVERPLGYVVLEVSRQRLITSQKDLLFLALGVTLLGIVVGGILALQLGEGVMRPVMRITRMIERLGQGDLRPAHDARVDDPLYDLQIRLNQMAQRLAWGREEMEFRVATVTNELRLKKEEAELATLAKSRFLAAASHDLRQPTHALGMFVARLGQLSLTDEARHVVRNLEASLSAMQDLLDGLLDLSRLEAGAVQAHAKPVPLQLIFDDVRKSYENVAQAKGLRLRVVSNSHWVQTDPVLLKQIVMNLVSNAIRYTDTGSVLLGARRLVKDNALRLDVLDTGIGIAPEHQERIFQEFFQIGNQARDRNLGLGLGLSIVQRTARLLGHALAVQSNLGQGTRFSIVLPLAEPVAASMATLPVGMAETDVAGMRVWLIEDDDLVRQSVADLLQSWGCEVYACSGGHAALAQLNQWPSPDVIVSDYRLADGMDGIETIVAVREHLGTLTPACLISGDTDADLLARVKEGGLTLLHKPVRPAKLRSFLRRLRAQVPDIS
ncbi:response regulator [Curvibacter sp. CHRR-16]|uniref:hybrid sensor histidine kinase/response regulator n=1 Tax=Curvibacter sp. CHRR-16 TaxID=2835872 RepID=UPI001BDAA4DD|nr:ATP-binding protein [Curvibacter sp. CHRR-16]MBT0568769.1 response regulator [Curvibacter sp. CHRR-16]